MSDGFIKIYRNILSWEWYRDQNTKSVFLHLLIMAAYKDTRYKGVAIPRGSFATSSEIIAAELGLTRQVVRTAIKRLKSTNEITTKSTNKFTLITIVNYDKYQGFDGVEQPTKPPTTQPATNQQLTSNQPAINQPSEEEGKKERSKEIKNIHVCFENFWSAYPKKQGKGNCEKWFTSHKPSKELVVTMLSALDKQKRSDGWAKENGRYIPMPYTWLNGKRWEDKIEVDTGREKSYDISDLDEMSFFNPPEDY